ncbi:unnamed protein product [Periconia digitata]|uniref:Uncharacterized protein n=1 Tax=Periconia digitata TaxID=1303443 RepID=A0A9W4UQS4_9PLEO|nr:unnamed protein product [Periconia digitata]
MSAALWQHCKCYSGDVSCNPLTRSLSVSDAKLGLGWRTFFRPALFDGHLDLGVGGLLSSTRTMIVLIGPPEVTGNCSCSNRFVGFARRVKVTDLGGGGGYCIITLASLFFMIV